MFLRTENLMKGNLGTTMLAGGSTLSRRSGKCQDSRHSSGSRRISFRFEDRRESYQDQNQPEFKNLRPIAPGVRLRERDVT
jgi:hypothetical protein